MPKLSTNKRKAIRAILAENTVRGAAKSCGLAERTLHHYLANDDFRAALRAKQDSLTAATAARLAGGVGKALATFEAVMDDPTASPASRVRAAVAWGKTWRDARLLDEFSERISALERQQ